MNIFYQISLVCGIGVILSLILSLRYQEKNTNKPWYNRHVFQNVIFPLILLGIAFGSAAEALYLVKEYEIYCDALNLLGLFSGLSFIYFAHRVKAWG